MGTSGAVCKGMKSIQYSGTFAVMVATCAHGGMDNGSECYYELLTI